MMYVDISYLVAAEIGQIGRLLLQPEQFLIMVLRDERRKRLANEHKITLSEEGEVKKEIVANSLDELLDQLKDYLDESHTKN